MVTGWPRGGMHYVCKLLQLVGYSAGMNYQPGMSMREFQSNSAEYEVSPYLVPVMRHSDSRQYEKHFVCRDPMRVLNTLMHHGVFHNERESVVADVASSVLPDVASNLGRPSNACCVFLQGWFDLFCASPGKKRWARIENPSEMLISLTMYSSRAWEGGSADLPYLEPINVSSHRQSLTPRHLPEDRRDDLCYLLRQVGYLEPAWLPRGGHAHYLNPDWHW